MNVGELIRSSAALYGDRPIIHFDGQALSYPDFADLIERLAGAFVERGLKPGDRVMILAKNCPEWIASYFAALCCGAIAVPVNPALTASEVSYIAGHAAPTIAMVDPETASTLAHDIPHVITLGPQGSWKDVAANQSPLKTIVPRDALDAAVIFYTSGTTGRPKGVMLSHAAVRANADIVRTLYGLSASDRTLVTGSLSFIYSIMTNCTSAISSGVTIHLDYSRSAPIGTDARSFPPHR